MRFKEDPQIKEILDAESATNFQEKREYVKEECEAISKIKVKNKQL